jgi:hypothetical protein
MKGDSGHTSLVVAASDSEPLDSVLSLAVLLWLLAQVVVLFVQWLLWFP